MTTMREVRPSWYTREDDSAWERVKAAFRRDWEQTKHDFGGKSPDLNQQLGDTVSQASGSKPIPPGNAPTPHPEKRDVYSADYDPAYKYGYVAYRHYGSQCEWCDDTESRLQRDWSGADWGTHRDAIHRGWNYAKNHRDESTPR